MRFASMLFVLGCLVSVAGAQSCVETSLPQVAPTPARAALGQMSQAERKNSRISVEFESLDSEDLALGREVERLWNGGQCDEALAQLGNLESCVGHVAIGNSWRKPVPTRETSLWGTDVRIGNRDSLLDIAFDVDPMHSYGNLFAVLRHSHGPAYYSVCMSTDGGVTWAEMFTWVGSQVTSLDALAFYQHFYVAYYSPGESPQQIRLRRFLLTDGSAHEFSNGDMWVAACTLDVGDTARELSCASGGGGTWQFIATLVSDGSVLLSRSDEAAVSWTKESTGFISGASRGLDGTFDLGGSYLVWMSYLDTTDTLRVCTVNGSVHRQIAGLASFCGPSALTSISGIVGHLICAYEDASTSPPRVRYAVSNDGGSTWTTGALSDTVIAADAPAVTANGYAFQAVFRQESPTPELRYCWRTDSGPWSIFGPFTDHEPYWSHSGVKVAYPGYGVVYLSDTSPVVRGAYFDRTDWTGVAEQRRPQASNRASLATVVRRVLFLPMAENGYGPQEVQSPFSELLDASGRRVMDLHAGVNDVTALAPGVYFVRAVSRKLSAVSCSKVVITR